MVKAEKEYLIHKPPVSALLIFALPMMLGNFFQQAYTMADSVIVGRFVGEDALAAVGASYSLTNVFISIAIGGGVGASVITSQTFGRRDYPRMKRSVSTALLAFLAISIAPGRRGPPVLPADHGAPQHPPEHPGRRHHLPEHLLFGPALPVHVQRAVLHVQRPGAVPHPFVPAHFLLRAQCGPGHLHGGALQMVWRGGWATLIAQGHFRGAVRSVSF